jgi:hypothetical protein
MFDFSTIAYVVLGLSLLASAFQLGHWLLTAQPGTIIAAGRLSVLGLAAVTPIVLAWLACTGRADLAMMFAAFILPVAVQSAHRWRAHLFRPRLWPRMVGTPSAAAVDSELVRRSAAVLEAYLREVAWRDGAMPRDRALAVLGLEPDADADAGAVVAAHRRLVELLDPARGGTRYLAQTVDAARDALLGPSRSAAE